MNKIIHPQPKFDPSSESEILQKKFKTIWYIDIAIAAFYLATSFSISECSTGTFSLFWKPECHPISSPR